MAKACNYTKYVVVALLIVLAIVVVMQCSKGKSSTSSTERFEMDPAGLVQSYGMSPPDLKAAIEPRSNLPEIANNPMLGDAANAVGQYGAAPPQPVMMTPPPVQASFASMGGAPEAPNVALSSQQAADMLGQTINGGAPQYMDPILPLGDIHQVGMDPTDPANFMAIRTVFAPLKRQYGNQVDFIRGDIDVKQEFRGWFDTRPATQKDIQVGYFNRYLDVQQETAIKDSNWSRVTPVQTLYDASISPAANQQLLAYANV